ncbi:MAG: riboflavin biosynthesis protein RibF [Clostridia bacterium]
MDRIDFYFPKQDKIVLGLGFFDSLHLGHREIVLNVKKVANLCNAKSALFTFTNNFLNVLGVSNKLIYTFEERTQLLEQTNIDVELYCEFDRAFASLDAQTFFDKLIKHNIVALVCGFDYTFSCQKANVQVLQQLCDKANIKLFVIEQYSVDNIKVSTTRIKQLISSCNIEEANKLLGSDFFISGQVVAGRGQGKKLGFPTANLSVDNDKILPQGVFIGESVLNDKTYRCIVNIGAAPTFNVYTNLVEVHIIGFNGDLYQKTLAVTLLKFIRETKIYKNPNELKAQLMADSEYATKY